MHALRLARAYTWLAVLDPHLALASGRAGPLSQRNPAHFVAIVRPLHSPEHVQTQPSAMTNTFTDKTKGLLNERDAHSRLPIYFRAPAHGHDPIFSLSRAKLYQLDAAGLIKSVSLREKHQLRATRLFVTQSVADYIAACAARDEKDAVGAAEGRAEG